MIILYINIFPAPEKYHGLISLPRSPDLRGAIPPRSARGSPVGSRRSSGSLSSFPRRHRRKTVVLGREKAGKMGGEWRFTCKMYVKCM